MFVDLFPALNLDSGNGHSARRPTLVFAFFSSVTRGIFIEVKIFRIEVLGKKKRNIIYCQQSCIFSHVAFFYQIKSRIIIVVILTFSSIEVVLGFRSRFVGHVFVSKSIWFHIIIYIYLYKKFYCISYSVIVVCANRRSKLNQTFKVVKVLTLKTLN